MDKKKIIFIVVGIVLFLGIIGAVRNALVGDDSSDSSIASDKENSSTNSEPDTSDAPTIIESTEYLNIKDNIVESATAKGEKATEIEIPYGVTGIGKFAFSKCKDLTKVVIPETVVEIEMYAFQNCEKLESIEIPDSVTEIGNYSFDNCESLKSVTLSKSLETIGFGAFMSCYDLTAITIPDSVSIIGNEAFENCISLSSIEVSENNETFCSLDGVLFSKDKTSLIAYPNGKGNTYSIPESATYIGVNAFSKCDIESIIIPSNIATISDTAFKDCYNLKSVEISDLIIEIGESAFANCTNLTSVKILGDIMEIGDSAFAGAEKIKVEYKGKTYNYAQIEDFYKTVNNG